MTDQAHGSLGTRISRRIYYEIVAHCNLRCVHCSDLFHAPTRELPAREIVDFHAAVAGTAGADSVLTGGEPTLHSEFEPLVEDLCRFGCVTVTTNGAGLSVERALGILHRNPRLLLQVSVDGASAGTFEQTRGRGTFERVMGFLVALAEHGMGRQLGISVTALRHNLHEVDALIELASRLELAVVHFPQLVPVGFARENWDRIAPAAHEQLRLERRLLDLTCRSSGGPRLSVNRLDRIAGWLLFGQNADCLRTLTLKVGPDGEILPCPTTADRRWSLGSFRDRPQPQRLLERIQERIDGVRLFADKGCNGGPTQAEIPRDAGTMRSCESCWLLCSPRADIVQHGRTITEAHVGDALASAGAAAATEGSGGGASP